MAVTRAEYMTCFPPIGGKGKVWAPKHETQKSSTANRVLSYGCGFSGIVSRKMGFCLALVSCSKA
jgi:hypothetical protein